MSDRPRLVRIIPDEQLEHQLAEKMAFIELAAQECANHVADYEDVLAKALSSQLDGREHQYVEFMRQGLALMDKAFRLYVGGIEVKGE